MSPPTVQVHRASFVALIVALLLTAALTAIGAAQAGYGFTAGGICGMGALTAGVAYYTLRRPR